MCGIAGIIDLGGTRKLEGAVLDRMVQSMYLRGPDDDGFSRRPPVELGMRRLSIIDVAGGHQPIENEDGSVRVVLNGEIYSSPDLREELLRCGHTFRTRSDTEVLVHGYEEWGTEGLLERLNGMFAFALQDQRNNRVVIARDRLGIKPLLYASVDAFFIFASTTKALVASGMVPATPDPVGVRLYLHNQFVPGPHSIVAGVKKLQPAHYLVVQDGVVLDPVRYWRMPERDRDARPLEEWAALLRTTMEDAVERHMLSDVEVGVFLSGGLDSTTVLGLMSQRSERPIKAFSVGFEGGGGYDETPYARIAARRFGADLHTVVFTAAHVGRVVHDVVAHLDEPVGDSACLPTFVLARDARTAVKVVQSGEGADELFGGYRYYQKLLSTRNRLKNALGLERVRSAVNERRGGDATLCASQRHRSARSGFPYVMNPALVESLLDGLDGNRGDVHSLVEATEGLESVSPPRTTLDTALRVDTSVWLPDNLLMKVDGMTMANSLEARVPFLDHNVVSLAMRMPDEVKISGGVEKLVMRRAFADLLGDEIGGRDKHGFGVPMGRWFNGELAGLLRDVLGRESLARVPWLRADTIAAVLDAHRRGVANFERQLWALFVLVSWFRGVQIPEVAK